MADFTPANAFEQVADHDNKTNLIAAFDDLLTAMDTAQANGAFSAIVATQLKGELVDCAERVASNMADATSTTTTTAA